MNLSLSLLGWLHTAACLVALVLGPWMVVARKGTPRHRRLGDIFVAAMLFASVTSLGIYTRHAFTAAHGFGVAAIVFTLVGFVSGRWHWPARGWRYAHIVGMLGSYYVLMGGLVNEVFLRVTVLRPLFFEQPQLVGMVHGLVMMAFVVLIALFVSLTAIGRARLAARAADRAAA